MGEGSSAASHESSSPDDDRLLRRRVASYALAHRTCARLRACLADPVYQFGSPHRMFADMVFFVETQRTDAHDATIRDVIARGGDVVVGAYDPTRVTHLVVADGCFDSARAMTPPWTRFGPDAALAALTRNPAEIFGVEDHQGSIEKGRPANLVLWSADPLEVTTLAERVVINGIDIPMTSRQTELRDRYAPEQPSMPRAYIKP